MAQVDPLLRLREATSSSNAEAEAWLVVLADNSDAQTTEEISQATHLSFSNGQNVALSEPTRFISKDVPVDLRSIYFAWQSKDVALPEYIDQAQTKGLTNLAFVERLDLITWLEGASNESEHIKALEGDAKTTEFQGLAPTASGVIGAKGGPSSVAGKSHALGGIYKHEQRLADRNSILRGIKPTDFSHVKKAAELILKKEKGKPGASAQPSTNGAAIPSHLKKNRRPEPIILLSPSASSLLRMSNVKSFLDSGVYTPPDSNAGASNLLHITRVLPTIDPNKPLRFILVEGPDAFKPDYWNRVVAVFTTGQAWQFKSYKWTEPSDLFSHVLGIYVGWKGEPAPAAVRGWGRGVRSVELDKWTGTEQGRWRDREVVEKLWAEVEDNMRRRGWSRDTGPR